MQDKECDKFLRELRQIYRNASSRASSESQLQNEEGKYAGVRRPREKCTEKEHQEIQRLQNQLTMIFRRFRVAPSIKETPKHEHKMGLKKFGDRPRRTVKRARPRAMSKQVSKSSSESTPEDILNEAYGTPKHNLLEEAFAGMSIDQPDEEDILKQLEDLRINPSCPPGISDCEAVKELKNRIGKRAEELGRSRSLSSHRKYQDLVQCYKALCKDVI